ncbi:MAG: hypothetical protein V5A52_08135 [Halovenus sp.]|uniref:hypothetical protein n=1 Tax=Halovenus amylolytica TaxID=2500550 RepID=UPI002FC4861A
MKLAEEKEGSERGPEQVVDRVVTVHSSSPDRAVFTEKDNTEGWISTDYTVELLR